ncbi:MAG: polyphosphate kinase 1 [Limisphaerales bacterium]
MSSESPKLDPHHLLNRELSWLEFNQRVLEEALDPSTPLLERLRFFCAFSSNLDEFFEVRVAGLKQQMESPVVERSADGLTATETLQAVNRRVRRLVERQYACWRNELRPELARHGIRFLRFAELSKADLSWVEHFYRAQVRPVLTPLGLDTAHPFPQLLNKSLNMIVQLEMGASGSGVQQRLAVVQVPRVLPRLVQLPHPGSKKQQYLFLGEIIGHFLADLFPGTNIPGCWNFRVTRNNELYANEEEAAELLKAVESELQSRRRGVAVRLEVEQGCPPEIRAMLLENLGLKNEDLFVINGPINPIRLMAVAEGDHSPELREPPWVAPAPAALREETDFFDAIRRGDILLHHPYENFGSVVDFLKQAAADPNVLAIKQTLYRTGGDPQIVGALMEAVQNGKQVAAVVELKAPDEDPHGVLWPRRLEEAGVHVVYGLLGCKVHAKMCLVVRKDTDAIRRYLHLSTGNYNPVAARFKTDVGLLTCRPAYGEDAASLFNLLTGICQFQGTKKLLVSPFELHDRMLKLIERETANARKKLPARIIARMNSLSDPRIIAALYGASRAGVRIDLIVRGVCCLRPGIKGVSERITVRSIVDRFVEHSRIFYFENACQPDIFIGSADWTPRSFFRRIEVVFPIDDGNLRERIRTELLETALKDNVKARFLTSSGSYKRQRPRRGAVLHRSQNELLAAAAGASPGQAATGTGKAQFPRFKLAASPFAAPPR